MRFMLVIIILSALCFGFEMKADKASGGEEHTLVGVATSDLWSCGNNSFGQLGVGDNDYRVVLEQILSGQQDSTPNTFLIDIFSFDAGWQHSICCDSDGFCWAWGNNANYCLGIGSTFQSYKYPVQVLAGQQSDPNNPHTYLENIIQVSAGRSGTHSLAIEETIDPQTQEASYRGFAWGNNSHGQLGVGDTGAESTPSIVLCGEQSNDPNGNPYFAGAVETSAGEFHSMLLDDSGNVFCMGDNTRGQIGGGDSVINNTVPVKVLSGEQSDTATYLENVVAISAGWNHSIALEALDSIDDTKNGRVYCWGSNEGAYHNTEGGKLGNGLNGGYSSVPVRVKSGQQNIDTGGLVNIVAISAGECHNLALDNRGNVWAWGDNKYGQLGVGSQTNHYTPVKVAGGEQGTEYLSNIVSIAAGYWHNVAITSDGEIYAWGENIYGKLALGDTNRRLYPCRVNNPTVGGNVEITFDHIIENYYTDVNPIDTDSDEFTLSITITNPDISDPNYIGDINGGTLTLYLDAGCDYEWFTSFSPLVYDPNFNTAFSNTFTGSVGKYVWQIGQITAGSSTTKSLELTANQNAYPGGELKFKAIFDIGDRYSAAYYGVPIDQWQMGNVIYVDSKAANRWGNGTSWDYAFVSLNKALDRASEDPNTFNEIWVAEGFYYPNIEGSFVIPAGVEIYGGFEGDPNETQITDRDYIKNVCRLNGYGSDYVVKFENDEDNPSILDGFTITGGAAAGIYCNNASPEINNSVIAGNGVIDFSSTYGIQLSGSDAVISDCIIANNSGAAIKADSSSYPNISRCMIKDNGAGIDAQNLDINNSVISNNNDTGISASNGNVINCTILSNTGYGISGFVDAENNILWANNDYGFQYDGCDITYSCIFDPNDPNSVDSTYDVNYNISANPEFLFTSYNNYVCILASNSPCIDKGGNTPVAGGVKDFYNQDRIYNNTVDIGAVEYTGDFDDIVFDLNRDAVVNYQDFVYIANTWFLESIDTGYNSDCDWSSDDVIDTADLEEFVGAWLWQPPIFENASLAGISKWTLSYQPLTSQSIVAPIGGMMMAMQTSVPLEIAPQVSIEAPEEQTANPSDNTYEQMVQTIIFLETMWNDDLIDMTEAQWLQFKQGLINMIE